MLPGLRVVGELDALIEVRRSARHDRLRQWYRGLSWSESLTSDYTYLVVVALQRRRRYTSRNACLCNRLAGAIAFSGLEVLSCFSTILRFLRVSQSVDRREKRAGCAF